MSVMAREAGLLPSSLTPEHFARVVDRVEVGAEFLENNMELGASDIRRSRYIGQVKCALASLERVLAALR